MGDLHPNPSLPPPVHLTKLPPPPVRYTVSNLPPPVPLTRPPPPTPTVSQDKVGINQVTESESAAHEHQSNPTFRQQWQTLLGHLGTLALKSKQEREKLQTVVKGSQGLNERLTTVESRVEAAEDSLANGWLTALGSVNDDRFETIETRFRTVETHFDDVVDPTLNRLGFAEYVFNHRINQLKFEMDEERALHSQQLSQLSSQVQALQAVVDELAVKQIKK